MADLELAPFHVLATEGAVHTDGDYAWHMAEAAAVSAADDTGVLFTTAHRVVDLTDPASEAAATAWWEELTRRGGEGCVFRPSRSRISAQSDHGSRTKAIMRFARWRSHCVSGPRDQVRRAA